MDSVNVIVKGDFGSTQALRRIIEQAATKTGRSSVSVAYAAGHVPEEITNSGFNLRTSHLANVVADGNETSIIATRLINTEDKSWMTETEGFIMEQAQRYFGKGDVTVFNVNIKNDEDLNVAETIARMTGGAVFSNWRNKDIYSIRMPIARTEEFDPSDNFYNPCVNAFVAPEGWTLFDIAALAHRIVMEHKAPNARYNPYILTSESIDRDADTGIRKTAGFLIVEDVNGEQHVSSIRVTRSDPPSISSQCKTAREMCFITELARRMGAERAYNLDATENMRINTSSFGVKPIPSLASDKTEILVSSMLKNNAMINLMDDQSKESVEVGILETIHEVMESQPEPKVMSEVIAQYAVSRSFV